jgi:hypothetical protein
MMTSRKLLASSFLMLSVFSACADDETTIDQEVNSHANSHAFKICGTRDHSDAERQSVDNEVKASRQGGTTTPVPGGTINVYFHAITDGTNGKITDKQIGDQINVLNQAYAKWGWSFNLVSTDRATRR